MSEHRLRLAELAFLGLALTGPGAAAQVRADDA
jgi:hypothetical protein